MVRRDAALLEPDVDFQVVRGGCHGALPGGTIAARAVLDEPGVGGVPTAGVHRTGRASRRDSR
jgi:hypothetical protein